MFIYRHNICVYVYKILSITQSLVSPSIKKQQQSFINILYSLSTET